MENKITEINALLQKIPSTITNYKKIVFLSLFFHISRQCEQTDNEHSMPDFYKASIIQYIGIEREKEEFF